MLQSGSIHQREAQDQDSGFSGSEEQADYQAGEQLVDAASLQIQLSSKVMQSINQERNKRFRPICDSGHPAVNDPAAGKAPELEECGVRYYDSVMGDLHPHLPCLVSCNINNNSFTIPSGSFWDPSEVLLDFGRILACFSYNSTRIFYYHYFIFLVRNGSTKSLQPSQWDHCGIADQQDHWGIA